MVGWFKRGLNRLKKGQLTYKEFFAKCIDAGTLSLFGRGTRLFSCVRAHRLSGGSGIPPVKHRDGYHIKDIRLPMLDGKKEYDLYGFIWEDTFSSYMFSNDNYDEAIFDYYDSICSECIYGLVSDKVNVTVEPGDIVIDAGSWIGDFAAYASVKGATTYAFEPSDDLYVYLEQTAKLNRNIIPVKQGLSDESGTAELYSSPIGKSEQNSMTIKKGYIRSTIHSTRLDDFVRENHLPRVDFIKADIEGFERRMLAGAQEILARFAPKLALCTYNLPDDPQVMADLILKANPKYNIVQKRMKLFASVPD